MSSEQQQQRINNEWGEEGFDCIHISKLLNDPEGHSTFLKEVYRINMTRLDKVYVVFPSGREMALVPPPPEKFDEMVDHFAEICENSTAEDW